MWAFNEEITAKAIYDSKLPIISGVGHEVDFTIADFVADVRAPTPSAAAEIAVPDRMELLQVLQRHELHALRCMKQILSAETQRLSWVSKHLLQLHPRSKLTAKMQQLDFHEARLAGLLNQKIQALRAKLSSAAGKLDGISPLATLQRGYAIATDTSGHILHLVQQVKVGDQIKVRLNDGTLGCEVTQKIPV